tara:strand:+ start:2722 stop:3204 length:483 start_codon:yes stop_codon:yes gene_type:complete
MGVIMDVLREHEINQDDYIYLSYENGIDTFHYEGRDIETALHQTDVADVMAEALATKGIKIYDEWDYEILDVMRKEGLLTEYQNDFTFEQYLSDVLRIHSQEYEFLTAETRIYDHKRGYTTVQANIKVKAGEFMSLQDPEYFVNGWNISVQTGNGKLQVK